MARVVIRVQDDQFHADLARDKHAFTDFASHAEKETSRMSRGVLAGSGAFHHLGRSIAFASGAFLGAAGFMAVMRESVGAAQKLETQTIRTTAVFGDQAKVIKAWSEGSVKALSLTSGETLSLANNTGAFLKSMGVTGPAAATYSEHLVKLGTQLARLKGIPLEEAMKAVDQGLVGRGRALAQLGIHIDAHAIKEKALADGLVTSIPVTEKVKLATDALAIAHAKEADALAKYGTGTTQYVAAQDRVVKAQEALNKAVAGVALPLTNAQKAYVAYQIIMEQSGKTAQSYAVWTHTLAGEQAKLHAGIGQLQEGLGKALIPTILSVTTKLADWIGNTKNQHRVQGDLTQAVSTATGIFKFFAGILKDVSGAVGGLKHLLELLVAAFVAVKAVNLATWGINTVATFRSVGAAAAAASGEAGAAGAAGTGVGGLLSKLTALKAIGAIAVTITVAEVFKQAGIGDTIRKIIDAPFTALGMNTGYGAQGAKASGGAGALAALTGGAPQLGGAGGRSGTFQQGNIVRTARSQLGIPYLFGGAQLLGHPTDCAGLAHAVLAQNGIQVGSTSEAQWQQGTPVGWGNLQPGDLVFFDSHDSQAPPSHVGIYIGGGQFIEDPHTGASVRVSTLSGYPGYMGARRYVKTSSGAAGNAPSGDPSGKKTAPAGSTPVDTSGIGGGGSLIVGHAAAHKKAKQPKIEKDPLIPDQLKLAYLTATGTTGTTADDLAALEAIKKYLDARIAHTKDIDKKIALLNTLGPIRAKILAIEKKIIGDAKKEEALDLKQTVAADKAAAAKEVGATKVLDSLIAMIKAVSSGLGMGKTGGIQTTNITDPTTGKVTGKQIVGTDTLVFNPQTGKYEITKILPDENALKAERKYVLEKIIPMIDKKILALRASIKRLQQHPQKNKAQLAQMHTNLNKLLADRAEAVLLAMDLNTSISDIDAALAFDPNDGGGGGAGGGGGGGAIPALGASAPAGLTQAQVDTQANAQAVSYLGAVRGLRSYEGDIAANPATRALIDPMASLGGATITIVNNNQATPEDPHLWSNQIVFELKAILG